MLQVESPQTGHGNALVGKRAVEEDRPSFQRLACPLLESEGIRQEVDVLLFEFARRFLWLWLTDRLQGLPTDMLHNVVTYAQGLRDYAVGNIFVRSRRRIRAPEPEKQHCLLYFGLLLTRVFFKIFH
jgi:hypothetical protein